MTGAERLRAGGTCSLHLHLTAHITQQQCPVHKTHANPALTPPITHHTFSTYLTHTVIVYGASCLFLTLEGT